VLGVSVEIDLKWIGRGVNFFLNFQFLHIIDRWDYHGINTVLNRVLTKC